MKEATPFYRFAQWLVSSLWRLYGSLEVRGASNIPDAGPFLLLCNHQSNLDPMLIQSVAPRPVHAMAKSTQFAVPVVGRLMRHLYSFPVRRHRVDPHAVRLALRYLREGYGVCIYVEGERSWDGRLQKPRRGTIRLALKAGVPVIPCVITGSYDAWPRWDRRIRRHHVRITFGPPIPLPYLDRRAEREDFLDQAADRVMGTIARMLAEAGDPEAADRDEGAAADSGESAAADSSEGAAADRGEDAAAGAAADSGERAAADSGDPAPADRGEGAASDRRDPGSAADRTV